ncbi:hypothetical protein N0V95_003256 [Ascochyta clinopodiicola]|nr:hypothetical protein N0V95_003256 [Ascochyta clinopodiicola]
MARHFVLHLRTFAGFAGFCAAQTYFDTPPGAFRPFGLGYTKGAYPQDFNVVGQDLEAVHDSQRPSTGLAVDNEHNLYLTYPRNAALTPSNVVICTSFNDESPWPNAAMQNCTGSQDPSTCFINVQNIVLDDVGRLWIVDSGIPYGTPSGSNAVYRGAKLMSFNATTRDLIRTYIVPQDLLAYGMNMNDLRLNTTLGYAFMTDASRNSSLVAINLNDGSGVRRLFNESVVRADEKYVGSYDGELIYSWNGTQRNHITTAADGIALASGNFYWGVLASRRFYYISQEALVDTKRTDADVLAAVQNPGQCASEQAGFTADDKGRVYIAASEQNAVYYVDTLQSQTNMTINGHVPSASGNIPANRYVLKTLIRNAMIQHADSMAILDGWLYFNTNQLALGPPYQYNNVDKRKGPFRSFRIWIGRGPAA